MSSYTVTISPKTYQDDNRYDPTSQAIMEVVNRIKHDVMYMPCKKNVDVTLAISFVRFGNTGDREEPKVWLEIKSHE